MIAQRRIERFIAGCGGMSGVGSLLLTGALGWNFFFRFLPHAQAVLMPRPLPQQVAISSAYLGALLLSSALVAVGFLAMVWREGGYARAIVVLGLVIQVPLVLINIAGSGFFYLPFVVVSATCLGVLLTLGRGTRS